MGECQDADYAADDSLLIVLRPLASVSKSMKNKYK
jgi:hypothetical protein